VFLTFATANEICNNIPTSRIDIVCQINDIEGENADIKLSVLAGDNTLDTHVPD
jgi:hypothetical protein